MRKILFCDVDGTILRDGERISLEDWKALNKARDAGCLLVFCTSRNRESAREVLRRCRLSYDCLIANNGSRIEDFQENLLFHKTFSHQTGIELLQDCLGLGKYEISFYDPGRNREFILGKEEKWDWQETEFFREAQKTEAFEMVSVKMPKEARVHLKFVRIGNQIRGRFGRNIQVSLNTFSLDMTPGWQSKGTGVLNLLWMLGGNYETASIGDSSNDVSMFEITDCSYTFRHCENWVKDRAGCQVDSVCEAVERFLGRQINDK